VQRVTLNSDVLGDQQAVLPALRLQHPGPAEAGQL